MKRQPTHGQSQRAYAKLLIEKGVPYAEILADSALEGFNRATLRSMRLRHEKKQNATQAQQKSNDATQMQRDATPEKAEPMQENTQNKPETAVKVSAYEVAYFTTVGITATGIITALQWIGVAVALVHCIVAYAALQRCKTAEATVDDLAAVVFSGLAVGVPADIVWANKAVWANVGNLPLRIQATFNRTMYSGQDIEIPFYIACYIAGFLWVSGIVTAWMTLKTAKIQPQTKI